MPTTVPASATDPARARRDLLLALALSAAAYLITYRLPWLVPLGPLRNLAATLLATVPLALATSCINPSTLTPRAALTLLLVGAALLRLCMPLDVLVGSEDAYRYIWDGMMQYRGINPYAHPPAADILAPLRDDVLYPQIFRPDMRTVYPPLAQLWFLLAYLIGDTGFVGLKLIYLLNDLASTWLLTRLLARRGQPPLQALLYAWSPLVVVQGFAGGHLDGLIIPWLLLALLLAENRPALAGAALGLATLVRPIAALCGPALALRRPFRATLLTGLGFVGACCVLLWPYASAGGGLVESLFVYAEQWRFNGSLFRPLDAIWGEQPWFRFALYATIAAGACATGLLRVSRPTRALFALSIYFVLAPTVYPWYLTAVLALLALHSGPLPVLLPLLITLSDLVFLDGAIGGQWEVPRGVLWLEYGAIYALALWQIGRTVLRGRKLDPSRDLR